MKKQTKFEWEYLLATIGFMILLFLFNVGTLAEKLIILLLVMIYWEMGKK